VSGYPALLILIAAHVLAAAFGPLGSVLITTGRQKSAAYVSVASLPVQAALSTVLIGSLGVPGAALGAGAGLLLTQLALYVLAGRKGAATLRVEPPPTH
jgi:O-antigen/teichoic acid export membrane protein